MSRFPLIAAFTFVSAFALAAPQEVAPTRASEADPAAALMDRMDAKRFGDTKVGLHTTLRMHGIMKLQIPGRTAEKPLESDLVLEFDGARMYERMDFGPQGLSLQGFDGQVAWMTHPVFGDKVFDADLKADQQRLFGIVRGAPWRQIYDDAKKIGEEQQDSGACPKLQLWSGDDSDVWVLDAATGLPIRIEIVMRSDEGDELVQLHYSDWRPVAGVLYPFAERCSANGTDAITVYDAIEAGVALPEEHFALPDAIRKLQEQEKPQERSGDAQAGPQPSTQIVVNEEQPAASIRIKIKPDQANRKLAELLPEVMACLTEVGASAAGPPFARFHGEQDGEVDFEAGVPVAAPIAPRGRVKPSTLPGGRSAMAWYSGPYSGLKEARARLAKSLVDLKLVARGGAWVSYWTDTSLQRDRKQCRSQLFQPVE